MKKESASAISMRAKSTLDTKISLGTCSARPVVWSIAGSDSGGGAGLQADLKAMQAFGVHGCTAVSAITAQNSVAVTYVEPVSAQLLDAQLSALAQDMPPLAIKTGLLGSVENILIVCRWVDRLRSLNPAVALVVDPVLGSSTGVPFANDALIRAYTQEMLPRATLVTPNQAEAQRLGLDGPHAQSTLLAQGVSICITGGDTADTQANDWLVCPQATGWLSLPRIHTPHHHGTGCTFAACAAAALASGYCVADAVVLAKMATAHALRHAYAAGQGAGPVMAQADFAIYINNLPSFTPPGATPPADFLGGNVFAALSNSAMGIYAVVDSAAWVRRVLAAGVRTVQLRIKDPAEPELAGQIEESVSVARATPGAQLFINDHWQLALKFRAYGVHLGQEDLEHADLQALRQSGVRLGVSTHSYWEVARAWGLRPSYVACGPIFATQSKDMPWMPQGLDNLRYWVDVLPLPVVGIAGIDPSNVADLAATGAASAAVLSSITKADDPESVCAELMSSWTRAHRTQHNSDLTASIF